MADVACVPMAEVCECLHLACARETVAEVAVDVRGKLVHICVADDARAAELRASARRHGAKVVNRRVEAQVMVVDDIGAAGPKVAWTASLLGVTVMSPQRLLTAGQLGPYVAH